MLYKVIRVNKKGDLLACPNCDNEELTRDDDYCMICGYNTKDYHVELPAKSEPSAETEGEDTTHAL